MASRRSRRAATNGREERKKRQEKFRKRTRSLFNKTRLLAKDTDAWVALIVRDRAGRVQSFRSSGRQFWPPSIQDLMAKHPSDTHEFLEKQAISGCWKTVAEDESDTGLVDGDAESVDESVPAMSVTPVEEEVEPDSTILVDQGEEVEDGANTPMEELNENVVEGVVDPLESIITPLPKELDETLVDARRWLDASIDAAGVSGNPRVDSPEENAALDSNLLDYTITEFAEPDNMTVDAVEEFNNTATEMAAESHDTTAHKLRELDSVPDVPIGATTMEILGTAEPDPAPLEYDMMDLDISKVQSRALSDVRQGGSLEAASTLHTMSQYHNPPHDDGGLSSWQVLNWPKMDPKELLQSWTWVFHK